MNAMTMIAVVRQMLADGSTDEQIANVLNAMGFGSIEAPADDTPGDADIDDIQRDEIAPAPRPGVAANQPPQFRGGATPTVKYQMVGAWTPAKLAQRLNGRKLQVASLILASKNGITKREILTKLQAKDPGITNGAVMSALAPLGSVMNVIKSVPINGGTSPRVAPRQPVATATVRSKRG